jgi:hypothetical protein
MTLAAEVGILPAEFWQITERELMAAISGYRHRQVEEWKRARLTAYMTYAVNAKNPEKIEAWLPLEGDTVKRNTNTLALIKKMNTKANEVWGKM